MDTTGKGFRIERTKLLNRTEIKIVLLRKSSKAVFNLFIQEFDISENGYFGAGIIIK